MRLLLTICFAVILWSGCAHAESRAVPRTIIALYDSSHNIDMRQLVMHRFFEMPANYLGLNFEYHDVQKPLPELDDNVRGIIIGFEDDPKMDVVVYIDWLLDALKAGKRLAIVERLGVPDADGLDNETLAKLNRIYDYLGVRNTNTWYPLTHKSVVIRRDEAMVDFERKIAPPLPAFEGSRVNSKGTSHLRVLVDADRPETYADLIVTGPQGGYIAPGYAFHEQELQNRYVTAWYVNPFQFLRKTLRVNRFPVPDVTTRAGRRIFYSHIDGDGWNNMTLIEAYRDARLSSADVIEREILEPYKDFGFSVGIVAGDMVDNCFGSDKSRATARRVLALPNVEVTNHTYTHPLFWQFFEDYTVEKEAPYAAAYPKRAGLFEQDINALFDRNQRHQHKILTPQQQKETRQMSEHERLMELYDAPRSYNCVPFDEDVEILVSSEIISSLAPEGKKIRLMQWSGNTSPYERFLRKTREAGLLNINGGESRFDNEYPSYSSLFPIGVKIGAERQIYSSASNENTYTNLWSERFFGYRYLVETVQHTEEPLRVSPFNVYFHSYSGERPASVKALKEILDYARSRELIPMYTSDFAEIANGFYSAQIDEIAPLHWRIKNRGALQTVRFDKATALTVDMSRSVGVLGFRHYQDNLYIFFNPSVDTAELYLVDGAGTTLQQLSLQSSRWDITQAQMLENGGVRMQVQGFGDGEMAWHAPDAGTYTISATDNAGKTTKIQKAAQDGLLQFTLEGVTASHSATVEITPMGKE